MEAAVYSPRGLAEALEVRAAHPEAVVLAGGTDLMVMLEAGVIRPAAFLNLRGVRELAAITAEPGAGGVRIGALATHAEIARSPLLAAYPALVEACRTVGAVQIQNRGTLGGNVVNASPAGDTLPVLLALGARLVAEGPRGRREIAAERFWTGYRRVDLAADELLSAIILPPADPGDRTTFRKIGTRQAQSISKVVYAARLRLEGGAPGSAARVVAAGIAFGSVGPVPLRCPTAEAAVAGRTLAELAEGADACARAALADIAPIDDIRSTAAYRRAVAVRSLRSWLQAGLPGSELAGLPGPGSL